MAPGVLVVVIRFQICIFDILNTAYRSNHLISAEL